MGFLPICVVIFRLLFQLALDNSQLIYVVGLIIVLRNYYDI